MKKTKLFTSLAALALVLGLGACETTSEEETTPEESEETTQTTDTTTEGGEEGLVFGFELEDGLVGIDGNTVTTDEGKSYSYEGTYTTNLDEAVRVSYEAGSSVGEYYLSFELDGATYWITITEGNYTNLSYATDKAPIYWNPTYECWGNKTQTYFLCYNAAYDCLYASSISGTPKDSDVPYIETSPIAGLYYTDGSKVTGFVGDVYQEPGLGYEIPEPNIGVDKTYKLGALDASGYKYVYLDGKTTSTSNGTFLTTTETFDNAASFYITSVPEYPESNAVTLSYVDSETDSLKYLSSGNSSTTLTYEYDPCVWIWVAEDEGDGYFAVETASTGRFIALYTNDETARGYAHSNLSSYSHFIAYETEPAEVVIPNPESIVVDGDTTVVEGYKVQLTATVYPEGAASDVTWSSGDETYATVNENGLVFAKAATESVTITATSTKDTNVSGSITIAITERTIPEGEICSYDFSLSDDNTNSAMDAERTLAYFDDSFLFGSAKESVITNVAKDPTNAYPTAGGSGTNTNLQLSSDCLKLGGSGKSGSITITSSQSVSKIVVYGTCWGGNSNSTANLTINSTEHALEQAADTTESVSELTAVTFEFNAATEITIVSSNRCMIFVMELY